MLDTFSYTRHQALGNSCPWYIFLTLPLTDESVPHYSHLVSKIDMLASWQGLCENVGYLLISKYVLKLHCPFLNIVTDEVVSDPYVFSPVMKNWILHEFYATLIIIVNQCRPQLLTK